MVQVRFVLEPSGCHLVERFGDLFDDSERSSAHGCQFGAVQLATGLDQHKIFDFELVLPKISIASCSPRNFAVN